MEKKKNEKGIRRWFTWHLFPQPKDIPIQSVYEMLFFALIFFIFLYVYKKCNEIPYCKETIQIECLDNKTPGSRYGIDYIHPTAFINFRMPYTSVDELKGIKEPWVFREDVEKNGLYVDFENRYSWGDGKGLKDEEFEENYMKVNRLADSIMSNPDNHNWYIFSGLKDSLYKDISVESNRCYWESYGSVYKVIKDKYELFKSLQSELALPEDSIFPLYYYKYEQTVRKPLHNAWKRYLDSDHWEKNFQDTSALDSIYGSLMLYRTEHKKSEICYEGFMISTASPQSQIRDPYGIALGDPGWFTLEDISQAYFHFMIKSQTIDWIHLRINFVGSTEFSKLDPEPDEISMNHIAYYDRNKIERIKSRGLLLHAKFAELENRQTIRLFFLTAVMSAIFTIFVGFIVLAFYKIATNNNTEKKDSLQNEFGKPGISDNNCHDSE